MGELHEHQCVKYPFPENPHNSDRMKKLEWRKQQVMDWQRAQSAQSVPHLADNHHLLAVNWTKSYVLEFLLGDDGKQVAGVDLRQGARVIKTVRLHEDAQANARDMPTQNIFGPPASNCTFAVDTLDPLARVELKPPHRKSSAL